MSSPVRIKDRWNEQRILSQRTLGASLIVALLTLTLIGRLVYLQVDRHDYYVELAQGNRVRVDPIPASRGLIVDRDGHVLADNEPAYQLELIREHRTTIVFCNARRTAERLAARLNELAGEELVRAHHGSLAREQRLLVESDLKAGRLRGIVATMPRFTPGRT